MRGSTVKPFSHAAPGRRCRHLVTAFLAFLLAGCATVKNDYDPLEGMNRVTYALNDGIDAVVLKPLATVYVWMIPGPVRDSVSNFFDNLAYANVILNDFLQGKGRQGMSDFARLSLNTTIGIGGLFDVATPMGFEEHDEDFGQTLAVWGVPQGAYLVLPIIGPSSLRHAPGLAVKTATDGLFYLGFYATNTGKDRYYWSLVGLRMVDIRARADEAFELRRELALDPYVFTREAWLQRREYLVYDGNPPSDDDDWDEDTGDEFDDAPESETTTP